MGNKRNLKNINVNKIDADSFGESLLFCAPQAKDFCRYIDIKIARMAHVSFIPWTSAGYQYDQIIDSIYDKTQLINLYNIFVDWYKRLDEKQKRLYKAYFIRKSGKIYQEIMQKNYRKDRFIIPMIHSFINYIQIKLDFEARELIKNPYIYSTYIKVRKNNKKALRKNKGGSRHDNSANERCDCCCLRN